MPKAEGSSPYIFKLVGWLVACRLIPVRKTEDQLYQFRVSHLIHQENGPYNALKKGQESKVSLQVPFSN